MRFQVAASAQGCRDRLVLLGRDRVLPFTAGSVNTSFPGAWAGAGLGRLPPVSLRKRARVSVKWCDCVVGATGLFGGRRRRLSSTNLAFVKRDELSSAKKAQVRRRPPRALPARVPEPPCPPGARRGRVPDPGSPGGGV